jgi:hypothetical protein
MNLGDWQRLLEDHYKDLSAKRRREAPDRRVFSLEHGLNANEIQDLSAAIRAHIAEGAPLRKHALPWIVYAAEIGYRYSGDQYWQTFEEETPYWTTYGDRYWIRNCYLWFQKEFFGVVPRGAWASHFSIICWPITNAILPKDLQKQLARILYDLRDSFSAEVLETPSILGDLIAARSWSATSRFQNFAQETELVGQIASALLLHGESSTDNLIHPATLKRIGQDVEHERISREWLQGARRVAKERAHVRGLGLWGQGGKSSNIGHQDRARAEIAELGIEPRLVLRPTGSTNESWDVSLEIPDMSHLLLRFPKTREILTGSRCVVAGAAGRPLARGRCLYGAQRIVLTRWPRADEVLLKFEQTDPQLEYLLRTECLLRPGSTWLFRIASDGLAYECRSLRVRPGTRYIMVSTNGPLKSNGYTNSVNLSCADAYGAILDLPRALNEGWEKALHQMGLGQAKTVEVWPAGLAAAVWDGEGHGEWLASERPCLGIRSDYSLASLLISMSSNPSLSIELTSIEPGEPVFVKLPDLPIGLHTVHISAKSNLADQTEPLGDLDVVMRIREALPWSPGVSPRGPLMVQMEPATPSLEQLWEGRVEITLRGLVNRRVKCQVSLFEKDGSAPSVIKHLPPLRLPVNADGWRIYFEKNFRKTREAENSYDSARICGLYFSADELGAFSFRFEREFTPLRWAIRRRGSGYSVRLLDDSGDDEPPEVIRMSHESPCVEEKLKFALEYDVPEPGGMYVARTRVFTAAIIVPPMVHGLADLGCISNVDGETRTVESILHILSIARLWGKARLPGDFISETRRRAVLRTLVQHIAKLLCGNNWASAESAKCNGSDKIVLMKDAISNRREEVAVGIILARDYGDLAAVTCEDKVKRTETLATKFQLLKFASPANAGDVGWLSEFALRLASDPVDLESWAGERTRSGLARLMESPVLARAARFLVLATDHHLQSRSAPTELYAGWSWS